MNSPIVDKHYVSLIVPFAYRKSFADCIAAVDPERFEPKEIQADRLFDYAEHLVSADPDRLEAIGRRWMLKQAARTALGLPNNYTSPITCKVKEQEWTFNLREIELYLFETQVGLLQYTLEFSEQLPIDRQIEAIYYLRKLMNYSHSIHFEQRRSKDEAVERTIQLSELSKRIVQETEPVTFFEGKRELPTEALVFSSILLKCTTEQVEEVLGSYLFHMRRSFKATYKASNGEYDLNGNPDLLRLFENGSWGISLEGLGNIVTKTDDPGTNQFFTTQYFHHIQNTYAYLYILVLHQKYALLHLTNQAAQLSYELQVHGEVPAGQGRVLRQMKDRIVNFMLRASYKQVSRSTHHAAIYEWVRDRLQIDALFSELHETLNALAAITEAAAEQQRLLEEEKKRTAMESFNKKITGITAVFLPLTIIIGIYGIGASWLEPLNEWWIFLLMNGGAYLLTFILFKVWINKD